MTQAALLELTFRRWETVIQDDIPKDLPIGTEDGDTYVRRPFGSYYDDDQEPEGEHGRPRL